MKKRNLTLLAFMLAFAMILTSCKPAEKKADNANGDKVNTEGIEAKITVQYEEGWKSHYEKAKERVLEKNPKADIKLVEIGSFDNLNTIDSTSPSNEDVPDVYALPLDRFVGLAANDALAAVDAEAMAKKLGGFNDFSKSIGEQLKVDNDYLAFPFNIETLVLYINKTNAQAQNIDITKPIEMNNVKYDNVLVKIWDAWFGVGALNAANIELLTKTDKGFESDMTKDLKDLPAEKQEVMKGLYKYGMENVKASTALFDKDASGGYIESMMATGKNGVVTLDGPWAAANYAKMTNEGKDLEIQPIGNLTIAGHSFKHWKGGWALGINSRIEKDKDKMALSEAMIMEIVNPKYAKDLFESTGKILENVSMETYEKSDLSDFNKKVISAVKKSYDDALSRPLFKEWGGVWTTWENAVLSWNNTKPSDENAAYNQIKSSFEAMMRTLAQK